MSRFGADVNDVGRTPRHGFRRRRTSACLWMALGATNLCSAFTSSGSAPRKLMTPSSTKRGHRSVSYSHHPSSHRDGLEIDRDCKKEDPVERRLGSLTSRRSALLLSLAATTAAAYIPSLARAQEAENASPEPLETLQIGQGKWELLDRSALSAEVSVNDVPASFCTYATRFLLHYDPGVSCWWNDLEQTYHLLTESERQTKLGIAFASLANSIERAVGTFLNTASSVQLWDLFARTYGQQPDAPRQIALLFSLLPTNLQPTLRLREYCSSSVTPSVEGRTTTTESGLRPTALSWVEGYKQLLPDSYDVVAVRNTAAFTIAPPIALDNVGVAENIGQSLVATAFGPLASEPLTRDLSTLSPEIYALFGLAGATGCALTHGVVIPLDVVKTRAQTDPNQFAGTGVVRAGIEIAKTEGIESLLLGAQATLAGFFWYGLSVYPSYTFFKRFITLDVLSADVAVAHANDIALIAGALAAVIASLGLTPLEAARIRVVDNPDRYRPLGLTGTLGVIASEEPALGWTNLYAGLPSLLARQVIFGSVKFLAFERACEFIFDSFPFLRDETWTSLAVSLVAGGLSGILSSVVSQPADSVLTYVARESDGDGNGGVGILTGARNMVAEEGLGSLFRGVGSRCVWAGCIIAGQFLLYDVFRTYFGVNSDDLSQAFRVILPDA